MDERFPSPRLRVKLVADASVEDLAERSAGALDTALARAGELTISTVAPGEQGVLVGAYDVAGAGDAAAAASAGRASVRGSGGPVWRVDDGTVHVVLALRSADSLADDADPSTLLNRYVRPLLRALTKVAAPAHYFGRDWVSVRHRPVAAVAFAHDATTGRAAFEALVSVRSLIWTSDVRASFLGKKPAALDEVAGRPCAPLAVAEALAAAYAAAYAPAARVDEPGGDATCAPYVAPVGSPDRGAESSGVPTPERNLWEASVEQAIGLVGAARTAAGTLVCGGEFMASRDAMRGTVAELAALGDAPTRAAIAAAIARAFAHDAAVLFGVSSAEVLVDVLEAVARQKRA